MSTAVSSRFFRRRSGLGVGLSLVAMALMVTGCGAPSESVSGRPGAAAEGGLASPQLAPARPSRGVPILVDFAASPFPYRGDNPDKGTPFLDVSDGNRLGHSSGRGGVHWEDETYSDRRSLIYIPRGFDPAQPAVMVVFFHGNQATLERDVRRRQGIPRQLADSGLNAVLVAPQFAVDVKDSSAGRFWQPGAFSAYLSEAATRLSQVYGSDGTLETFARMPVVLVAYSGGYYPAAYALTLGGANDRIAGVALFDALYGDENRFDAWINSRGSAFFFSAYSKSAREGNLALEKLLASQGIGFSTTLPDALAPGSVTFVDAGDVEHLDFMTQAWTSDPLRQVLARVPGTRAAVAGRF